MDKLSFYLDQVEDCYYVSGVLPDMIKGAIITIEVFYNDKKIYESRGRAYKKEGNSYKPSTKFIFKLNRESFRVFVDGIMSKDLKDGVYKFNAYTKNTTPKYEASTIIQIINGAIKYTEG